MYVCMCVVQKECGETLDLDIVFIELLLLLQMSHHVLGGGLALSQALLQHLHTQHDICNRGKYENTLILTS